MYQETTLNKVTRTVESTTVYLTLTASGYTHQNDSESSFRTFVEVAGSRVISTVVLKWTALTGWTISNADILKETK